MDIPTFEQAVYITRIHDLGKGIDGVFYKAYPKMLHNDISDRLAQYIADYIIQDDGDIKVAIAKILEQMEKRFDLQEVLSEDDQQRIMIYLLQLGKMTRRVFGEWDISLDMMTTYLDAIDKMDEPSDGPWGKPPPILN